MALQRRTARPRPASRGAKTSRRSASPPDSEESLGRTLAPANATGRSRSLDATSLLAVQAAAGNRAATRLVLRQSADVGPRAVSKPVPGLPDDVLLRVEGHLAAGTPRDAQAAIDLVVGVLAARGDLDLGLIDKRRMLFDPALTDEGRTRQWAKPAKGGGFEPLPSTVRIGPPALANASWLYSAIIHEYHHAERFQTAQSDPFKEVDGYLHNLERADEAGLDGGEVLEIWSRLRDEWADVPENLRPLYQKRLDAAEQTVRRISAVTGPMTPAGQHHGPAPVQRAPGPDDAAPKNQKDKTTLAYEGAPGTERQITEDDPEFRANYVDNNIVLATGLCVPGTTWGNIDQPSVPEILLTYADGRQLTITVADIPLVLKSVPRRPGSVGALRPLARYEKRADGFIYPIRTVGGASPYISYGDAANIMSLRAGLYETVEELKTAMSLMEAITVFSGAVAALGGIAALNASAKNGLFEFVPRRSKTAGKPTTSGPRSTPGRSGGSRTSGADSGRTTTGTPHDEPSPRIRTDEEPGPKGGPKAKPKSKPGANAGEAPDRQVTSGESDSSKPKSKKGAGRSGQGGKEGEAQTAAEKDWDKAEAEAKRQQAEKDKAARTEHGALRDQGRGALSPKESSSLANAVPHRQGDGATARVIKQKGGGYLVHITNAEGQTVTLIRGKTAQEVTGLSERYHWDPPWVP